MHFRHGALQGLDGAGEFLELLLFRGSFGAGFLGAAFELLAHFRGLLGEAFGGFVQAGGAEVFDGGLEMLELAFGVGGLLVLFAGRAEFGFEFGDIPLDVGDRFLAALFGGFGEFLTGFVELPVHWFALGVAVFLLPADVCAGGFDFAGEAGEVFFATIGFCGGGFLFELLEAFADFALLRAGARDEHGDGEDARREDVFGIHDASIAACPAPHKRTGVETVSPLPERSAGCAVVGIRRLRWTLLMRSRKYTMTCRIFSSENFGGWSFTGQCEPCTARRAVKLRGGSCQRFPPIATVRDHMTPAEFKKKWAKVTAKETSAYQSHFDDLCRLLKIAPPLEADPAGESFCYQKRVVKDAELFDLAPGGEAGEPSERGFADVWKRGCFAWEYKGRKKNLDEAYKQLLRYRESLLNPPLLVVCDFDRYIVRTNFNGTVQAVHEFRNSQIDDPQSLKLLRKVFTDPNYLRPLQTTAEVTEKLAAKFAAVSRSLQSRESVELEDAFTRRKLHVAQKKNLRIARFLNRVMFCFFAEDTGLLPKGLFSEIARIGLDDKQQFAEALEQLFRVMSKGGLFGHHKIRHFNGHLFEEVTVFELTDEEISLLAEAAEADWEFIQPSIMGTLFERALEPGQRSQLGAHYTSEEDIKTLVEPVLMAPWRREWHALRDELRQLYSPAQSVSKPRQKLNATTTNYKRLHATLNHNRLKHFVERLAGIRVLDPACGSGNFLYVSLRLLLDLEKEVIAFGTELDVKVEPWVSVQQLSAIEINPYAFELAQVSVQIGFLQWRRDNGFDNDRSPVLQNLDGFQNEDALLVPHFRSKAKTLKEAQAGEHEGDDALKFYTEREWPECDVIVGNPPFIGNKWLRREVGDEITKAVFAVYGDRLPATSDYCCYWFEKARDLIAQGKCQRAGLLATTGSKQISSRVAFERIQASGKIFFAISDRDWFDADTAIRICMVGFGRADVTDTPTLDGRETVTINPDLSSGLDTTRKHCLRASAKLCFMGTTKVGDFDIQHAQAVEMLAGVNPHGRPNSDVLRPFRNGSDLVRRDSGRWIVDFGVGTRMEAAALYEAPFTHVTKCVKPERIKNKRKVRAEKWWLLGETLPAFREATADLPRYIGTARVAKHRLFVWQDSSVLPDSKVIAIAFADDFRFGVLHSHAHEVWTTATCALHGGERRTYNPTECFETFPFPFPDDLARMEDDPAQLVAKYRAAHYHTDQSNVLREDPPPTTPDEHRAAIAAAAKELNEWRERWLNPPEWTQTHTLTFPGSAAGPWARYIAPQSVDPQTGIGTVRYPRLEPRDADCAAKLKRRTLTNLNNERPAWLALAHEKLDTAVAAAYGWPTTMSDDQILENLLALNLARAAAEKAPTFKPLKRKRAANDEKQIEMDEIR